MSKMKLSDFSFDLPDELIAEYPSENRDEARLMVIHRSTGVIEHKNFKDIINYFVDGDVMIMNNTRVFPARMYGNKEKTGAKIEVFLLRELNRESLLWDVLVDPARKIRIGNKLYFGDDDSLVAEVIDNTTSRGRTLRFLFDGPYEEFKQKITELGETPLPKYIKRDVEPSDEERYQTIFVEDLTKHKMDSEQVIISQKCVDVVNDAKKNKKRVCAIGTTSMRSIESAVSTDGMLKPFDGWTNKFIFPPYEFSIADSMVTNFHTPLSTLLMMISAFCGHDLMMEAYKQAVENKYRFYSYGDAMLIL